MPSKQLCLSPEGSDERAAALHGAQVSARTLSKITQIAGAEVRHRMVFEIGPDVLDRIEFRGIGRQILQRETSALSLDIRFDQPRAVRLQSIPHNQQLAADGRLQGLEELDDLRALDRAGEEAEVETPEAHPGNRRELLPREAVLQNGCLAFRGPGACAAGSFGQTRLVDEDDYSALPRRDFFNAGHLFFFQVAIAASSRSRARPLGRCTLQPSC